MTTHPIFQVVVTDNDGNFVATTDLSHNGLDGAYESIFDVFPNSDYLVTQSEESSRLFYIDNRRGGGTVYGRAMVVGYEES